MKQFIPKTIKIYGEDCYYVPHKVMKKLYDAEEHKYTYVMYNGNYYVKPSKLSSKAKDILKTNNVHFLQENTMFILSKLKLGQKANAGHLKTLVENQSYQIHGTLVYGDIMQWVGGDSIESVDHLNYAPEGTVIYGRQHYFGSVQFTKNNGEWFVTQIRCN